MSTVLFVCALVWMTLVEGVLSADYCYDSYNDETYYCEYGCCDDENDELDKHCCTIAGIIVGACIGGLVLISLIVVAICCCMKHKGQSGHVIGTTTTTSIVAVGGTTNDTTPMGYRGWVYGQPQPPGGPIPPAYQAQAQPPYQAQTQYPPRPPPSQGMYNAQPPYQAQTKSPFQAQAPYPPRPPPSEGMYNDPAYPLPSAPPPSPLPDKR